MRRLLLSTVALTACSVSAFAADLPSRRPPPPVYVPPAFSWTGAYFGINAGYAFDNQVRTRVTGANGRATALLAAGVVPRLLSSRRDGFTGGGQIGYNYAIEGPGLAGLPTYGAGPVAVVLGAEADAAYTDTDGTRTFGGLAGVTTRYRSSIDYVGTVRGRLGVALGTLLLYGTGGFAYGGVHESTSTATPIGTFGASRDTMRTGTAYGGGVEYAIPTSSFVNFFNSSAVTLKVEYLHYNFGDEAFRVPGPVGTAFNANSRVEGNIARAGLNYKLNFAPAPVVARY